MDYSELKFTDADKARIIENRNAIDSWIMDNIVPFLKENEKIYVEYGGEYSCPNSWNTVSNYHFAVYGSEMPFYYYGDKSKGYIAIAEKFGGYQPFNLNENAYDLFPVIDNWGHIKGKLLHEVAQRKESMNRIYSFEV